MTTAIDSRKAEKISIATEVLVIGGGYAGLKAAADIAANGYPVVLADTEATADSNNVSHPGITTDFQDQLNSLKKSVHADKRIEFLPETLIHSASGVPGDFSIRMTSRGNELEKKVGAVVVATDIESTPLNHIYGLTLSDKVITLSDFEEMLASPDTMGKINREHPNVAFLVGFAQEGNPPLMKRILNSVLAVNEAGGATYVYVNDIKVADDDLERLYKEARDKGTIYFKLTLPPAIEEQSRGTVLTYHDPVLRSDVELAPDILVIEEAMTASPLNLLLAEQFRIDTGPFGFLQTDNVHRFPVASNREGIYLVGSTREVQNLPEAWTDVANTVTRIKNLLGDGTREVPRFRAEVDREKCVTCLTCYRCCPHGAIYWDDKAVISPVACQACGICASECPQEAIQLTGYADDDIIGQIRAALSDVDKGTPKILAFCCENSSYEAGKTAALFHSPLPEGLRMIQVPCAGKVDIHYILTALIEGADGVLVMACHPGNCKSETGTSFARWRVDNAYRMLEEVGLEKTRLQFVTLASNMAPDFSKIVIEMERRIR